MIRRILYRFFSSLISYFEVQLFLNLASLPLLIMWGLPFSLMTPLSNLILNPFLFVLLFLSSLIFFSELFFIPNYFLIFIFEKITKLCNILFSFGSSSWLIELPAVNPLLLITMPLCAFYILHARILNHSLKRVCAFAACLVSFTLILKYSTPDSSSIQMFSCNQSQLAIMRTMKKTIIVDPGALSKRTSSISWVEYNLIPHLISSYGQSLIDHFVVLQFNSYTINALTRLMQCCTIKTIYLPFWNGEASSSLLRAYAKFCAAAQNQNTSIIRIGNKPFSLNLEDRGFVSISPQSTKISHQAISYPAYRVHLSTAQGRKEIASLQDSDREV